MKVCNPMDDLHCILFLCLGSRKMPPGVLQSTTQLAGFVRNCGPPRIKDIVSSFAVSPSVLIPSSTFSPEVSVTATEQVPIQRPFCIVIQIKNESIATVSKDTTALIPLVKESN